MSIFTIYNPTTKHIAEEKFFNDFREAHLYCSSNYSDGYTAKHEPFNFSSDFKKMLNEGIHERVKTNSRGEKVAIIGKDGKTVYHCNGITLNEYQMMKSAGIKMIQISKVEFINLHNQLVNYEKNIYY